MKFSSTILLSLLLISLMSFVNLPNSPETDLIKKWKPLQIKLGENTNDNFPEGASLEFNAQKEYWMDGVKKGTWELSKDSKKLRFIDGDFGQKGAFDGNWTIEKLSADELIISTIFVGEEVEGLKDPHVSIKLVSAK
jgi:hypothetical protein